jgi:hypothetical protein
MSGIIGINEVNVLVNIEFKDSPIEFLARQPQSGQENDGQKQIAKNNIGI